MERITTVGIDLAKSISQIHAIDAEGKVIVVKAVRRRDFVAFMRKVPASLVGMEACASSHHWARELRALGHEVRLIPPSYVKAYVRRQKNDAADAAAICEAVGRPSMRFVPVKTEAQQAALMTHRVRALLVSQRTALICALRGHMAEFGLVTPTGPRHLSPLLEALADKGDVGAGAASLGISVSQGNEGGTAFGGAGVALGSVVVSRNLVNAGAAGVKDGLENIPFVGTIVGVGALVFDTFSAARKYNACLAVH